MKKRSLLLVGLLTVTLAFAGCGQKEEPTIATIETEHPTAAEISDSAPSETANPTGNAVTNESTAGGETSGNAASENTSPAGTASGDGNAVAASAPVAENHDHMYRSELSNEWIDESLKDQRPIAVMVDNEIYALPHFGVNQADVVYEIMNSTANNRVTRLMVLVKDWQAIEKLGSIRSVRTTNFMLAAEWNAILCHDGGPFYINDYVAKAYSNNLSGGFARYSNGKATEFTEYITYDSYTNTEKGKTYDGLGTRIKNSRYSTTYNDYYPGKHFSFSDEEFKLSDTYETKAATKIDLPFPHNGSKLFYNEETKTYDYYEYGEYHIDAGVDKVTTFKNVILQSCSFVELDNHGYLTYNVVGSGNDGYYITNGEAIPITWSKEKETALTVFRNKATGEEITLNTGKTYIGLVPSDTWSTLVLK